jgi:hypothetical protein
VGGGKRYERLAEALAVEPGALLKLDRGVSQFPLRLPPQIKKPPGARGAIPATRLPRPVVRRGASTVLVALHRGFDELIGAGE